MSDIQMINGYTPVAEFAGNVINGIYTVRFDNLQKDAYIIAFFGVYNPGEKPYEIDAEFGACLKLVCDGDSTGDAVIEGYDYLGQPIRELITLNGATGVTTKKAFKFIKSITTNEEKSITVTRSVTLGLPYRTSAILTETRGGVKSTATVLTAPVDEQSESSGDPRGTVKLANYELPTNVVLICIASPEIFTRGEEKVGGLFGVPHFSI